MEEEARKKEEAERREKERVRLAQKSLGYSRTLCEKHFRHHAHT